MTSPSGMRLQNFANAPPRLAHDRRAAISHYHAVASFSGSAIPLPVAKPNLLLVLDLPDFTQ